MKRNREVIKSEIRLKNEKNNIERGVRQRNAILNRLGFILWVAVAILKTSREIKVVSPARWPKQSRPVDNEQAIRLSKSILKNDPTTFRF